MGIDQLREDSELGALRRELDRLVANRAMTGLTVSQREEYLALCARERRLWPAGPGASRAHLLDDG
jgi:hypothetical protein